MSFYHTLCVNEYTENLIQFWIYLRHEKKYIYTLLILGLLSGCTQVVTAPISIAGSAVSATADVAGSVAGAAVDVVTDDEDEK